MEVMKKRLLFKSVSVVVLGFLAVLLAPIAVLPSLFVALVCTLTFSSILYR